MFVGLLLGILIGLMIGPVLRSWLTWKEYEEASREARLTEDVLRLMAESGPRSEDPSEDPSGAVRSR